MSLTVGESLNETNRQYAYDAYGTWNLAVLEGEKEDWEKLSQVQAVEKAGTSVRYGTLKGGAGIGTVDETLIQLGRLGLQDGKLLEKDTEIAMEADILMRLDTATSWGRSLR